MMWSLFVREPVLLTNLVAGVIGLVVGVGVALPVGLEAALVAFIMSVATIISRSKVTPV